MKKITVRLKERSYPIFCGVKLKDLGAYLARRRFARRILVITNPRLKELHASPLVDGLSRAGFDVTIADIPDGEKYKTLSTVNNLYRAAVSSGLDRRSCVIALGGGVAGDIAGFFAATYMRGIAFVQVPTTLLAMVDSSVGGKTGVDMKEGKNLVGAFYQPKAVWIDVSTLKTLPEREWRNGLAEVIKYGIISDAAFFRFLEKALKGARVKDVDVIRIIARCVELKARVVEKDEYERKGLREILNFGHTFGHAIETLTGYKTCKHGEAVAIGMRLAALAAEKAGMLKPVERQRIEQLLVRAGLPLAVKRGITPGKLIEAMHRDKKVREGKLRLVLPKRIGRVIVRDDISERMVLHSVKEVI